MNDAQFLAWIRTLPSCLPRMPGDDSSVQACHIRRANNSGVGMKPPFSAVPMTANQHKYQHDHGETACLTLFLGKHFGRTEAHEWFDKKAEHYRMWFLDGAVA